MSSSLLSLLRYLENSPAVEGVAVDVGAHKGDFSRLLLNIGCFDKVFSFEPMAENFRELDEVSRAEGWVNFFPIHKALGERRATVDINHDEDLATASILPYKENYKSIGERRKQKVEIETLDRFLICGLTERLAFLKIDTQGNDLAVLRGGEEVIARDRPIIQTEFIYTSMYEGQCSPRELTEYLLQLRYYLYSLNNLHVSPQGRLAFCDALFVPVELQVPEDGPFRCIDAEESFQQQLDCLSSICEERLDLINRLNSELELMRSKRTTDSKLMGAFKRISRWAR